MPQALEGRWLEFKSSVCYFVCKCEDIAQFFQVCYLIYLKKEEEEGEEENCIQLTMPWRGLNEIMIQRAQHRHVTAK